jgi:hypothetical protein
MQTKAKPKTQNPHMGRKTGFNHLRGGPGKTAQRGLASGLASRNNNNMYLQRETEEKARQPETKVGAIAQTRHKARLLKRKAKLR